MKRVLSTMLIIALTIPLLVNCKKEKAIPCTGCGAGDYYNGQSMYFCSLSLDISFAG